MECGGSIGKSKRHNKKFIGVIAGSEGSLVFISRADSDLVIARVKIKFSEVFCFAKAIVEVINAWDGEVVLNSNIIETTIVDTHPHRSIFLFHEKDGCTKRAARGANVSSIEVFIDLAFCLTEFVFGLTIEFAGRNFMIG